MSGHIPGMAGTSGMLGNPEVIESALQSQVAELENRNSVLTGWVDDLQQQNSKLEQKADELEEELEKAKEEVRLVKDRWTVERSEWEDRLKESEAKANKAAAKLEDKEQELRGVRYELEEVMWVSKSSELSEVNNFRNLEDLTYLRHFLARFARSIAKTATP